MATRRTLMEGEMGQEWVPLPRKDIIKKEEGVGRVKEVRYVTISDRD